jgi:hypothetical protein
MIRYSKSDLRSKTCLAFSSFLDKKSYKKLSLTPQLTHQNHTKMKFSGVNGFFKHYYTNGKY